MKRILKEYRNYISNTIDTNVKIKQTVSYTIYMDVLLQIQRKVESIRHTIHKLQME